MYCGHCDAPLATGAQFCSSCGYRVILPNDPEAALYQTEAPTPEPDLGQPPAPAPAPLPAPAPVPVPSPSPPASAPEPVRQQAPAPSPAPRPAPTPAPEPAPRPSPRSSVTGDSGARSDSAGAASSGLVDRLRARIPAGLAREQRDDQPVPPSYDDGYQLRWWEGRPLGVLIGAGVAAVALLAVLATWIFGGKDDPTPPAASPSIGVTPSSASAKPTSAKPSATKVTPPRDANKCSDPTKDLPLTSYSGSSVTSCKFADTVRAGYVAFGAKDGTFKAKSPVTGRTYDMVCKGSPLVTCEGGNNARVYLIKK